MDVTIEAVPLNRLCKKLGLISSRLKPKEFNNTIGGEVLEFTRDHLDTMSPHRHKCADRLGAKPTRHLEYASGRVSNSNNQGTDLKAVDANGFTISIRNTPGLFRAFGPVTVKPKKARWLTIPIHKDAYGKKVADLRQEGRKIFRPGKARILAETIPSTGQLRPLYALCQSTTAPQDKGLLPTKEAFVEKTVEVAEDYLMLSE